MAERYEEGPFWRVYQDLKAGRISRREFIVRATSLGVGLPIVLFVLNAVKVQGSAAQSAPAGRPATGTENIQRGAGGELKILQWQAATHLSLHNSTGTKDSLAASLITEPLMNYLPDGTLIPNLVTEVPSVENGLLSPDLKTVTYKLLPDVKWSDGEPFTADDVIFTWQWILDPANQSVSLTTYQAIENIEKVDDLTVKLTFKEGSLAWYFPFTGTYQGSVYPKHFWDGKDPQAANDAFRRGAIGTGPYKVESFTENDQVTYVINENYREPNKPFFSRVIIKGGGDAASAAQAVLQTGDWHFAWNLQVAPNILREMEQQGGKGKVVAQGLGAVERVLINFSDPNDESKGERAHKDVPHPFLTDKAVRQALSLASDRATISNQFYLGGDQEPPAVNILTGIAALESPNTSWEFNLDKAKQVLDEAGWVMDGDVRKKGDIELKVTYFTSINPVRQQTQAVNKQNWEAVGFKVTLGQVDAAVFFDSAAGNDQNASHFFRDLQMYTNGPTSTYPLTYMQSWYAGPNGSNIAQKSNGWSGVNESRYQNPEYDALYESLLKETDAERAAETFIKMNDIIINDVVVIPLVNRAAEKYAIANGFVEENIAGSLFEALYWNIANWVRVQQ